MYGKLLKPWKSFRITLYLFVYVTATTSLQVPDESWFYSGVFGVRYLLLYSLRELCINRVFLLPYLTLYWVLVHFLQVTISAIVCIAPVTDCLTTQRWKMRREERWTWVYQSSKKKHPVYIHIIHIYLCFISSTMIPRLTKIFSSGFGTRLTNMDSANECFSGCAR